MIKRLKKDKRLLLSFFQKKTEWNDDFKLKKVTDIRNDCMLEQSGINIMKTEVKI